MKLLRYILLALMAGWTASASAAIQLEPELTVEALDPRFEFEYDIATGIATATNGARVRYTDAILTADRVTLHQTQGRILAEGHVQLQRDGVLWVGDSISYDVRTKRMYGDLVSSGQNPVFARSEIVSGNLSNHTYEAENSFITTDDYENPAQRLKTKHLIIVPGEYLVAKDATLYIGKVPVMYWPYYRRSLKHRPNSFEVTPGYRSKYGAFLKNSYNWYWSDKLEGAIHADYRQKRGVGVGPDFKYSLGQYGNGEFKFYYVHDEKPGFDENNAEIRSNRDRLSFIHQATLSSNLMAKIVARYQSDKEIIHDFFESEYRKNVQPSSYFELNRLWSNFSLDFVAQPRLMDFAETVERLPDVKLTGFRQQLGESPFYYESDSSFGWFRRRFANTDTNDFAAWRGDTYHQLTLPQTFFGCVTLTPRVGSRLTGYSDSTGQGASTTDQGRYVFNTGAEISTKASRVWRGVQSRLLDADGFRHIIQPSVNYVYVPSPNARPNELPQFDYELQSYRLLPIDYPDYNAIDSIDSQNVLRFSLWNKLQTKRREEVQNLIDWGLYTDWRLNPRPGQGTFADVYSDLSLRPRTWITLSQEVRYNIGDNAWRELNHRMMLSPNTTWSFTVGNRYLQRNAALSEESAQNIYYTSLYFRLNENWGLHTSQHYEARTGKMEEQYYTIYRDMRNWTTALRFRIRENVGSKTDYTIALTLSLKAAPRFGLGSDVDRSDYLLGD